MWIHKLLITSFAIISISGCINNQSVYAYIVAKPIPKQSDVSDWRPVMRVSFRVSEDKVISEVANIIDEYEECTILNKKNWECQYIDGTGSNKFGFIDGKYWENPGWGDNIKYVSRLEYNLIRCKWFQFEYGNLKGTVLCLQTFI